MSKKIYMKPGIETVVYNNKDDNMNNPTYLTLSNHNFNNIHYSPGNKNTFTLHW